MDEIAAALRIARIEIKKYDNKLVRPIRTNKGNFTPDTFTDFFRTELGRDIKDFPELQTALFDDLIMRPILEEHAKEIGVWQEEAKADRPELPEEYKQYVLNMNLESQDTDFFVTKDDLLVTSVSGNSFIKISGMKEDDAVAIARKVKPEYLPRDPQGVFEKVCKDKTTQNVLNTYVPPSWCDYDGTTSDCLPTLFLRFIRHLVPNKMERNYLYSWIHDSLFSRAYVYLVLSGAPGVGKNTLKNVMKALHGQSNTVDGKESTLSEKFNGPLQDCTLHWFDELSYTVDMESRMKELQNKSLSIERKGIDPTRSTNIFASFVISNNEPRNNYIAYDARKFAALVLSPDDLKNTLSDEERDLLNNKVDEQSPYFDLEFVAQIARWIKRRGRSKKWPRLEYRGPKFWALAQSSMFQWQKFSVHAILTATPGGRIVYEEGKGFLFSSVHTSMQKSRKRQVEVPDYERVRPFLEIYRNLQGKKVFTTTPIDGDIGDFWVDVIGRDKKEEDGKHEKIEKEHIDL